MLENTATPLSLKNRNRSTGINGPNLKKLNPNNEYQQKHPEVKSNQAFEISKGNSLNYLKELSSQKKNDYFGMHHHQEKENDHRRVTWSPLQMKNNLTTQKRDHKSDVSDNIYHQNKQQNKDSNNNNNNNQYNQNSNNNVGQSSLSMQQKILKSKVTFKDELLQTEKLFQNKENQQLRQQYGVIPPSSSVKYTEQFKKLSEKLDRHQDVLMQQQYDNKEIFHENIDKSYLQNHELSPEWNTDALVIARSTVRNHQLFHKIKQMLMSIAYLILIILACYFFFNFRTIKIFKLFILISAVILLRTITYEYQFQNGLKDQIIKDIAIQVGVASLEFFCLMGFSVEVFQALLPSQIQLEIFWVIPSGFLGLMETILYWRKNQRNEINEEFLNIKCESVNILKESIKRYFQSFEFLREAFICIISSGIIVTCCYQLKTYYHEQMLYSSYFTKREINNYTSPFPEILLNSYYLYIISITIITRFITSLVLNFNYQLIRYSVVTYLGNYVCYQPLYTLIFKYPDAFSHYILHEAMKYWYTYQTIPLSQVVERTQYQKNLSDNDNKVLDTIFEFVQNEMNKIIITMSSSEIDERNQKLFKDSKDITRYFIKNRKIQSQLRTQRFLQSILKFTLIIISNSTRVFNMKIIEFLQNTALILDQMIQLFEKNSTYYTAEIADIIILKKEIVSNLQYIYSKMSSSVKNQNLSALTLSILCDSQNIYNEYDTNTQFVI